MKNLFSIILSLVIIATSFAASPIFASENVAVEFDGKILEFDVNPQIVNNRTLVPLRKIFEEIGALVKWNGDTRTVSARKNSKTVTLVIGSDGFSIDTGKTDDNDNPIIETVHLDVPAKIVSGRTLVPVRAISESFGLKVDWDEKSKKVIILSDDNDDDSWEENVVFINLTDLTFEGKGVNIKDNQIEITQGGDYTLSGTLADGNIIVSAKEKVKLRLNGVNITSGNGPCISVKKADKAYITLSKDTKNVLVAKASKDGAIYSKENLEIKGNGTLEIESLSGHGIKASDNLSIENGKIKINASNDGIHINDTFKMTGGEVDITSVGDGIDSESIVNITGGTINIVTNGVPVEPVVKSDSSVENTRRPMREEETPDAEFEKSTKGIAAEWMMCINGAVINIDSASHGIKCKDEIEISSSQITICSEYDKGISADGNLTINGKDTIIDIKKSTEGIESKNVLIINDGNIKVISQDDAINAAGGKSGQMFGNGFTPGNDGKNNRPVPSDGWWNSNRPVPSDGWWNNIRPPKDRVNKSSGEPQKGNNSSEKSNGRPQNIKPDFTIPSNGEFMPPFYFPGNDGFIPSDASMPGGRIPHGEMPFGPMGHGGGNSKDCIIINDGTIEIFGGDDGLDANGNIVINGGTVKGTIASGSFYGNFGIFDAEGKLTISEKASFVFVAQSGNANGLNLTQNNVLIYCTQSHSAGEKISVFDPSGNTVFDCTAGGSFKTVLVASPSLKTGEKYTVAVGNEAFETVISSGSTVIGTQPQGSFGRGQGMWQR